MVDHGPLGMERATEHGSCAVNHKAKKVTEIPEANSLFSVNVNLWTFSLRIWLKLELHKAVAV